MSEQTTFLKIPYPSESEDPFWDSYVAQMEGLDQVVFMNKIQNNLFVGGGGVMSFISGTGVLSWTQDLVIPVFHYGKSISIPYGPDGISKSATLLDGYAMVVNIPYVLTANVVGEMQVLSQLTPLNHQQWVLGWRWGSKVYFRGLPTVG